MFYLKLAIENNHKSLKDTYQMITGISLEGFFKYQYFSY